MVSHSLAPLSIPFIEEKWNYWKGKHGSSPKEDNVFADCEIISVRLYTYCRLSYNSGLLMSSPNLPYSFSFLFLFLSISQGPSSCLYGPPGCFWDPPDSFIGLPSFSKGFFGGSRSSFCGPFCHVRGPPNSRWYSFTPIMYWSGHQLGHRRIGKRSPCITFATVKPSRPFLKFSEALLDPPTKL